MNFSGKERREKGRKEEKGRRKMEDGRKKKKRGKEKSRKKWPNIILHIFSVHVPVKLILRFGYISKLCGFLISSNHFETKFLTLNWLDFE